MDAVFEGMEKHECCLGWGGIGRKGWFGCCFAFHSSPFPSLTFGFGMDCQFLFCEVTFLSFSFKTKQSLIFFEGCVSVRENNIVICYNHILLLLS